MGCVTCVMCRVETRQDKFLEIKKMTRFASIANCNMYRCHLSQPEDLKRLRLKAHMKTCELWYFSEVLLEL